MVSLEIEDGEIQTTAALLWFRGEWGRPGVEGRRGSQLREEVPLLLAEIMVGTRRRRVPQRYGSFRFVVLVRQIRIAVRQRRVFHVLLEAGRRGTIQRGIRRRRMVDQLGQIRGTRTDEDGVTLGGIPRVSVGLQTVDEATVLTPGGRSLHRRSFW